MRIGREWIAAAALLLGSSHMASAQGIARSFDQLQLLVRSGDAVTVRDAQGRETSGRIESLSASTLTIGKGAARRDFREADVTTIRQRRQDSLGNGALWGVVSGAALFAVSLTGGGETGLESVGDAVGAGLLLGGIGAAIGVGIDALIARQQVIFQRAGAAARLRVAPLVGRGRRGALLAVTF